MTPEASVQDAERFPAGVQMQARSAGDDDELWESLGRARVGPDAEKSHEMRRGPLLYAGPCLSPRLYLPG